MPSRQGSKQSKVAPVEAFVHSESGNVVKTRTSSTNVVRNLDLEAANRKRCRRCHCGVSVQLAVVCVVVACVFVSAAPQIVAWSVTSSTTTQIAAENLLRSISTSSLLEFEHLTDDAAGVVMALANAASRHPPACQPGGGGIINLWPEVLDLGLVEPRPNWYIGLGDLWGFHSGCYGAAPAGSYSRTDSVVFLQIPGQWDHAMKAFFLEVNTSAGVWQVADDTHQDSPGFNNSARPWFQAAAAAPGELRWGDIFLSLPELFPCIAVSRTWSPLGSTAPARDYCGAAVAMMGLAAISDFLQTHRVGESHIWVVSIDETQSIIASSTGCNLGFDDGSRMPMEQSENKLTRQVGEVTHRLRKGGSVGGVHRVKLDGSWHYLFADDVNLKPDTGFPTVGVYVVVPVKVYFARVQRSLYITVGVAVALLVMSAAVSLLVSWAISRPLRSLVTRMERVSQLESARGVSGSDSASFLTEIASLQGSMRRMGVLLDSFHKYVPMQVLRLLLAKGEIARLHMSRREAAILFCDIENFTPLTETSDPAVLLQVFTEFMDICTQSVDENNGLVDKLIGDACMAFWGYPGEEADQALNACRAALAITQRLVEARERWREHQLPQLNCRIGIAFGEVLVGNSGSSTHFNYTVLGSSVNLAARLEPLNKMFATRILCCASVNAAAKHALLTRHVARCRIKGFSEPQDVFEVLGERDTVGREQDEAVRLYNDAISAEQTGNTAAAVENLEEYTKRRPADEFARYQLDALCGGRGITEYAHRGGGHQSSIYQDGDYVLDCSGGV
eukprot:TRINITY_DN6826_c0_g1_i1.p1 TRINITY_DN6826_c0_g1~~TRINITY_DN6826_c0_g1_i1.p1  ORF type:complete len:788 (+),score=184.28 TRINITY_DN6826_c0_g1_i1:63-2426(+)